ncbi:tetratricopeptide repeat domain protein [Verrucomicrobiia bacterium DG1235]|nr:tetratricopeptide repeat domain protein [Verrucomicrobiae bacterium DG1235]
MKQIIKSSVALLAAYALAAFAYAGDIDELRSAVGSSKWEAAKEIGMKLTAAEVENGEAFHLLGKALAQLGEKEAAVDALKIANKLVKDNADFLVDYGSALIERGQEMNMFQAGPTFMRAMDQYKAAVKVDPDHVGGHIGLSRYYMNAPAIGGGSMKKAKEHAAEIARINPYLGHIEMALIAQKENRSEDAEAEFAAALAMDGNNPWLHFELAKLQQMSGKMLEAKSSYEKTLELDPEHKGAKAALEAFGG